MVSHEGFEPTPFPSYGYIVWKWFPWPCIKRFGRSNSLLQAYNHIHHIDGIMGDGGAVYTLGPQGNRPFRQGATAYPALPLPPLEMLPMSIISSNYLHHNGWEGRPRNTVPGDGTHGPGGICESCPAIPTKSNTNMRTR